MWIYRLTEIRDGDVIRRGEVAGRTAHDAAIAFVSPRRVCLDVTAMTTGQGGDEVFVTTGGAAKVYARNTWRQA